jgi:SAM-dependent methyltransferase
MKLGKAETLLVNNWVRAELQLRVEAPLLARLSPLPAGARVLEIGCGRGVGVRAILKQFTPGEVAAFDFDPEQVERARAYLDRTLPREEMAKVKLARGDATHIDAPDASFDAVFDWGVVHHVDGWRPAVREVGRVLKPGGLFYYAEPTRTLVDLPLVNRIFVHPASGRFTRDEFLAELGASGLRPVRSGGLSRILFWGAARREGAAA